MYPNVTATILGLLLLTLQSSVLVPDYFGLGGPDLFICIVTYLGLHRDLPGGVIPLVLTGFFADVYASTPIGLCLVTAVIIYLLLQLIRVRLVIRGLGTSVVFVVLSSLVGSLVIWILSSLFIPAFEGGTALLRFALPRAMLTIPFAIPVLWLMEWLDSLGPLNRRRVQAGISFPASRPKT